MTPDANPAKPESVDFVRKRPGMYLGDSGSFGLNNMVRFVLDCLLEAGCGRPSHIELVLGRDGSCCIAADAVPFERINLPRLLTELQPGCACTNKRCLRPDTISLAVVSALSARFELDLHLGAERLRQRAERGRLVGDLESEPAPPDRGLRVRFWPDPPLFDSDATFPVRALDLRLRDLAALLPGLRTSLRDEARGTAGTHHYPHGLSGLVAELARGPGVPREPVALEVALESLRVRAALLWRPRALSGTHLFTYANTIATPDGGSHVLALNQALGAALTDLARRAGSERRISTEQAGTSLVAVVSVDGPSDVVRFEGCAKTKLGIPWLPAKLAPALREALVAALARDPAAADALVAHALRAGRR